MRGDDTAAEAAAKKAKEAEVGKALDEKKAAAKKAKDSEDPVKKMVAAKVLYDKNLRAATDLLTFIETDDSWINSIAFSPDSQSLAAAGAGTVLRLFDLATRQVTREIEGNDDCIYCLAFSPDGK